MSFLGDIYLCFGIYIDFSFVCEPVSWLIHDAVLVILSLYDLATAAAILLPIKSLVGSAVLWIILFKVSLIASFVDCLVWTRNYWLYLPLKFLLIVFHILLAKDKNQ